MIKIKRGLDIPIAGSPEQAIHDAPAARAVAIVGFDYPGMKPTMEVAEGDRVVTGQLLFSDKKTEGVIYTAPGCGRVAAINRGARRVLQSVVIDLDGDDSVSVDPMTADTARGLDAAAVRERLVSSGQWTALRTRPFSKVPATNAEAAAIFVTAIDTHPLAPDPAVIIAEQADAFALGLDLLAGQTQGATYVCTAPGAQMPSGSAQTIQRAEFAGPHPAGLAGTHIHMLLGVTMEKPVWTIGYQDVIAIGRLFLDGRLYTDRVVALSGPQVENPRLLRTRVGADLEALVAGEMQGDDNRVISGSVLGGRGVNGATAYLGRYHNQVTVIGEGRQRELFGWLSPGRRRHSNLSIYLSSFLGTGGALPMTTTTNGSPRAMVPVGSYEKVMPMDILPTQLLRALIVGDTETAQSLGALELDEEDLALCTYVCPGKYEYGPILRDNLTRIEKEG
ncbi:Na(+)-translocating NADH-quinone reductase subunit A [Chromatocurvus halotolerans]|uniref:Na(+)-translocating NADH-quinone reductase subunit A n=1 Tax=Chromatocurvus halotolerans TaxID=1132028 RepID=A0A4R2KQ39_9GAMM|nr:Na(+)-translocating NADH-quinone reductase subunit A [Chromatocurvus halotolerans]TCO75714.1 Na+-transporting NADH:ubiquinone oxidoreductase subunit A [Chromatocurvus halotolerans]